MKLPRIDSWLPALLAPVVFGAAAWADERVVVVASAQQAYTDSKFGAGEPRDETYVFMPGRFFGGPRRDHTLETLTFRQLAESLAPELARQHYLPSPDLASADLLLVVHWGATTPRANDELNGSVINLDNTAEMRKYEPAPQAAAGSPSAIDGIADWMLTDSEGYRRNGFEQVDRLTEELGGDMRTADNVRLLGYTKELRRLQQSSFSSTTEETLLSDLHTERYFIIVSAYDLKTAHHKDRALRPVWSLHLNMRSPGQSFTTAMARMGDAAVDFFGRNSDSIQTVHPSAHHGEVILGPTIILGEKK